VEEETSSANYGSSRQGTPSASLAEAAQGEAGGQAGGMLAPVISMEPPEGEETNKKDAAAADDLRELAAKGVCAPLWRTSQPVQPVSAARCTRACMPAAHAAQCAAPIGR
jgi:hypothetical protein